MTLRLALGGSKSELEAGRHGCGVASEVSGLLAATGLLHAQISDALAGLVAKFNVKLP